MDRLRAAGLDPIPELRARGIPSWFETSGQLEQQIKLYAPNGSFYYLAPHEGFTFAGYMLARHLGGRPLQAGAVLTDGALPQLHPGEVVTATLGPGGKGRVDMVRAMGALAGSGLAISSVQRLSSQRS